MPISTSTFDEEKNYVSVRLQQGVPLLDSDWNEQDDIRRNELRSFIRNYIGDGVPYGNNGFCISGFVMPGLQDSLISTVNDLLDKSNPDIEFVSNGGTHKEYKNIDFCIGDGRVLVDGWEVINHDNSTMYTNQGLFENKMLANEWHVADINNITTILNIESYADKIVRIANSFTGHKPKTVKKGILVYLDSWERVVFYNEDENIRNEDVGVETCSRFKREWVVRCIMVDDDSKTVPDTVKTEKHSYYPLARIDLSAFLNNITDPNKPSQIKYSLEISSDIVDLRRTGVCLSDAMIKVEKGDTTVIDQNLKVNKNQIVNGKLGLGVDPLRPLHIKHNGDYSLTNESNEAIVIECCDDEINKKYRYLSLDVNEIVAWKKDGLTKSNSELNLQTDGGKILFHNLMTDENKVIIDDEGRVGIGTVSPSVKLEVNGALKVKHELMVEKKIVYANRMNFKKIINTRFFIEKNTIESKPSEIPWKEIKEFSNIAIESNGNPLLCTITLNELLSGHYPPPNKPSDQHFTEARFKLEVDNKEFGKWYCIVAKNYGLQTSTFTKILELEKGDHTLSIFWDFECYKSPDDEILSSFLNMCVNFGSSEISIIEL